LGCKARLLGAGMKIIGALSIVLAVNLSVPALAAQPNSSFFLHVRSGHFDGAKVRSVGADGLLLDANVEITLPGAAQLDEDVPADLLGAAGGDKKKSPLAAGTILYAAGDSTQIVYCGKPWGNWNQQHMAPCLTDLDGDGHFDQSTLNEPTTIHPPHLVLDDINGTTLHGVEHRHGRVVTFPAPVAYHSIDIATIPKANVTAGIVALSDYNKELPGPVHLAFAVWQPGRGYFGSLFSEMSKVTYTGAPVQVDLLGITITVLGLDDKGRPLCKLEGQIDDQVRPFIAQNVFEHIRVVAY